MELVKPGIGLIFWMFISFGIILFILKKFAWKPILGFLKEREQSIEEALVSAQSAKQEMLALEAKNEKLLAEARNERDSILKEAKEIKEQIVKEAKEKAKEEASKIIEVAQGDIEKQKNAAITELKSQVASLSVEIAEKLIKTQLQNTKEQDALVKKLIEESELN